MAAHARRRRRRRCHRAAASLPWAATPGPLAAAPEPAGTCLCRRRVPTAAALAVAAGKLKVTPAPPPWSSAGPSAIPAAGAEVAAAAPAVAGVTWAARRAVRRQTCGHPSCQSVRSWHRAAGRAVASAAAASQAPAAAELGRQCLAPEQLALAPLTAWHHCCAMWTLERRRERSWRRKACLCRHMVLTEAGLGAAISSAMAATWASQPRPGSRLHPAAFGSEAVVVPPVAVAPEGALTKWVPERCRSDPGAVAAAQRGGHPAFRRPLRQPPRRAECYFAAAVEAVAPWAAPAGPFQQ